MEYILSVAKGWVLSLVTSIIGVWLFCSGVNSHHYLALFFLIPTVLFFIKGLEQLWQVAGSPSRSFNGREGGGSEGKGEPQGFLDQVQDLCAVITVGGKLSYLNAAWEQQFGYPLAQLMHQSWQALTYHGDQTLITTALGQMQRGEAIAPFVTRHLHRNGSMFWLRWQPLASKRTHTLSVIAEDVTPHSISSERIYLQAIPDLLMRCRADGMLMDYYPTVGPLTNLLPENAIGKSLGDLMPIDLAEQLLGAIATALTSQQTQTLIYQLPYGGRLQDYEARITAYSGSEVLAIIRDITSQQAHLRDRAQTQSQLHQRLRQQAIVAKLGQKALANQNLDLLMQQAIRLVSRTLDVKFGYVLELLPNGQAFLLRSGTGWERSLVGHAVLSAGRQSHAGYTLAMNQPVIVTNLATETRFGGTPLLHNHNIVAGVNVLIAGKNEAAPFGVLGVHTQSRRSFTEHDIHFLQAVAHVLATAIARQQADEQLRLLERAIAASHNGVVLTDATQPDNPVIYVNPAFEAMTGYKGEEVIGRNCRILQGPETQPEALASVRSALEEVRECHVTLRNYRKDRTPFWNQLFIAPVFNDQGHLTHFVGIQNDITQRYQTELALQSSEAQYRRIVETAAEGIWMLDEQDRTSFVNAQMAEMLGYTPEEMRGKSLFDFIDPVTRPLVAEKLAKRRRGEEDRHDFRFRRRNGQTLWALISTSPLFNEAGEYLGALGMLTDITDRKQAEAQLEHFAFYDALTDLPNRAYFFDRLQESINSYHSNATNPFAVLFLDLDSFKMVNDGLGHTVGDHLLMAIARRLRGCLTPDQLLARLGGDEFTVLIPHVRQEEEAIAIAQRIHEAFLQPFTIDQHTIFSNVSIGIACAHPNYHHPEELLRDADTAMYQAKAGGKGHYAVFNYAMHSSAVERLQLETNLRWAIEQDQFQLYYQPIIHLASGKLAGFEALIRWYHPEQGWISPSQFIPVAEETRLILDIGAWVIAQACHQLQTWQQQWGSDLEITMNINLSARQFAQPELLTQIDTMLQRTHINPHCLKFEITESAIMGQAQLAQETLQAMKSRGMQLSIDDFGTGYSSLSYLHNFPVDTLKIDRSFLQSVDTQGGEAEIIKTIIALAHNLGMDVVAEGVETTTQINYLRTLGCELGQGYFFAHPLTATAATVLLQNSRLPATWSPWETCPITPYAFSRSNSPISPMPNAGNSLKME
ncbi:EAL domain-containing protein [Spirulina sp. CCNP1310]|uniref:EAL domain-containing protein n=1 Tax=Spirulina sp. CCNP1310 TaxID=3110249 RepID=UPI002B20AE01|nr:EAL domain-containing protein [Spirulina sp. CCNP1310]MEA5418241.1 EAL domain-containing protein [Spirulina sp. CCNP1310]